MTDRTPLHPGDLLPALTVALPGGHTIRLPDALAGHFSVILFCRGLWCPRAAGIHGQRTRSRFAPACAIVAPPYVVDGVRF